MLSRKGGDPDRQITMPFLFSFFHLYGTSCIVGFDDGLYRLYLHLHDAIPECEICMLALVEVQYTWPKIP